MSEQESGTDLRPFSTLLKMVAVAGLLFLGCFSACLGSITITLLRLRYDRSQVDIESGRLHRKSYKQNVQPARRHMPRSKDALAIAEKACDAALKRLEERIGPQIICETTRQDTLSHSRTNCVETYPPPELN